MIITDSDGAVFELYITADGKKISCVNLTHKLHLLFPVEDVLKSEQFKSLIKRCKLSTEAAETALKMCQNAVSI